jgi:hypothetical protein
MKAFLDSGNLLETVEASAEKNSEDARTIAGDLNETQLNWKPVSNQWSIAQCLEHLAITSGKFDEYFARAIARGGKKSDAPTTPGYKPSLVGGWLARQVDPVGGRNLRAPKIFRPTQSSDIKGTLGLFLNQQARFIDFVRQCAGIDYNKKRIRSPVTPLMRYSLADAFVITVLHGQRHLAQARRVREDPRFPRD